MAPKRARMARPAAAKAAAKAGAKAKVRPAAPKARVRIAAPRRRALRRPAAQVAGQSKELKDLSLEDLGKLRCIKLKNANYYGRNILVVGEVLGTRMERGEVWVDLKASGTKAAELLRALSGKTDRKIVVHACPSGCANLLTDEFMIHGSKFEEVQKDAEAWFTNAELVPGLEGDDELAALRASGGLVPEREPEKEEAPKEKKESKKEKKKKKKEKESKEKEKDMDLYEDPLFENVGRKDLSQLYEGTGLDPSHKKRGKMLKKARRLTQGSKKKKKKKDSSKTGSGSSDSSTTSDEIFDPGIFESDRKVKVIAKRYPGVLTFSV